MKGPSMLNIYKWMLILLAVYILFSVVLFIYRLVRKYIEAGRGE